MQLLWGGCRNFRRSGAASSHAFSACPAAHSGTRSRHQVVAGFQLLAGQFNLAQYDACAGAAGLQLRQRWATWDRVPWRAGGDYAVSVHRLAAGD